MGDMENENFGYGLPQKKKLLERDIGKYVILILPGESIAGKYIGKDEEGLYVFNPHQGIKYPKGIRMCKIINKPARISISNSTFFIIKPTTKKDLEGFCECQNKHINGIDKQEKIEL